MGVQPIRSEPMLLTALLSLAIAGFASRIIAQGLARVE